MSRLNATSNNETYTTALGKPVLVKSRGGNRTGSRRRDCERREGSNEDELELHGEWFGMWWVVIVV